MYLGINKKRKILQHFCVVQWQNQYCYKYGPSLDSDQMDIQFFVNLEKDSVQTFNKR